MKQTLCFSKPRFRDAVSKRQCSLVMAVDMTSYMRLILQPDFTSYRLLSLLLLLLRGALPSKKSSGTSFQLLFASC